MDRHRLLLAAAMLVAAAVGVLAGGSPAQPAPDARWEIFVHSPAVVDVVGPRRDGRLVLGTRGGVFLLDPGTRRLTRLAPAYQPTGGEPYIALSRARRLPRSNCSFRRDHVFVTDFDDTPGIDRIDRRGRVSRLADFPGGAFPSGIAFDHVGTFGNRLLVSVIIDNATSLYAIDCRGRSRVITSGRPRVEGGMEVAPRSFGRFAGWFIAADEGSGLIFGFHRSGRVRRVIESGLPAGLDIGVESIGFMPRGFDRRGSAYMSDLGAPASPTTGNDAVLRMSGADLVQARVRPGDMVVATEAAARTIVVRCGRRCSARTIGQGPDNAHGEGHVTFLRGR